MVSSRAPLCDRGGQSEKHRDCVTRHRLLRLQHALHEQAAAQQGEPLTVGTAQNDRKGPDAELKIWHQAVGLLEVPWD